MHWRGPDLECDCYASISEIYNTVIVLSFSQKFVSAQYLVNESMEFDFLDLAYTLTLTRFRLALLRVSFRKIYIMVLDKRKNFISAQYIENERMK